MRYVVTMFSPKKLYDWMGVGGCGLLALLAIPASGMGGDVTLESAGVRAGFSANQSGKDFYQAEAAVNWKLPWGWDLGRSFYLQSRLDGSVGWLGDRAANAAIGTIGPTLLLSREHLPISLEGGSGPTVMTRSQFGSKDFGIPLQFTSHVGLNWDMTSHWRLGYRFQHMSNAGLSRHNPGLNMNVFGLSYLF